MKKEKQDIKFKLLNKWWKKKFKYFISKVDKQSRENWGILQKTDEIVNFVFSYKKYSGTQKIIGVVEGEIVCFGQVTLMNHRANIEGVIVRTDLQRKGIGTKLMHYLEMIGSKKKKVKRITLEVFTTNKKGIKFYKSLGYKNRSKSKTLYVLMVKKIEKIKNKSK